MGESVFSEELRRIGREAARTSGASTEAPEQPKTWRQKITGIGAAEQLDIDRRTLTYQQFGQKYGYDASAARDYAPRNESVVDPVRIERERRAERTLGQLGEDYTRQALGAGIAATGSLANLAIDANPLDAPVDLAAGVYGLVTGKDAVNPLDNTRNKIKAGVAVTAEAANTGLLNGESELIKRQTEIANLEKRGAIEDSRLEAAKGNGDFVSTLRQIGRDTLIETESLGNNEHVRSRTIAQAVGSLAPSLAFSGGVGAAAREITARTMMSKTAASLLEKGAVATSVGLMEGQGAYDSTVAQIHAMTPEQLSRGSEEYRNLIAQGLSHEDAQLKIGHEAGARAAGITAPIAALIGLGVTKFEGNPFGKKLLTGYAASLGGQTVEEALQGGLSQTAGNIGVREFADENRLPGEGVGEAVVQGALGGFGATGLLVSTQSTGRLLAVTNENIKELGSLVKEYGRLKAEMRREEEEEKTKYSPKATEQRINDLDTLLNKTEAVFNTDTSGFTEEQRAEFEKEAGPITQGYEAAKEVLKNTSSPEYLERVAGLEEDVVPGNRMRTYFGISRKLAAGAYDENPELVQKASKFVLEERDAIEEYRDQLQAKTPEQTSPIEQATGKLINDIITNKVFSTAPSKATENLNNAAQEDPDAPIQPVSPRELSVDPVGLAPERLAVTDFSSKPAEIQKAAAVVVALNTPFEGTPGPTITTVGKRAPRTRSQVRDEFSLTDRRRKETDAIPSMNTMLSNILRGAIQTSRGGNTIIRDRRTEQQIDAQDSMDRLFNIIKHQTNKYEAGLASIELVNANPDPDFDARVPFDALSAATGKSFLKGKGRFYANPKSANSLETLSQVIEEANAGIRAYNAVLEQFPGVFKGEKIEPLPELDADMVAAAEALRPKSEAKAPAETKTEKKPEAAPANDRVARFKAERAALEAEYKDTNAVSKLSDEVESARKAQKEGRLSEKGAELLVENEARLEALEPRLQEYRAKLDDLLKRQKAERDAENKKTESQQTRTETVASSAADPAVQPANNNSKPTSNRKLKKDQMSLDDLFAKGDTDIEGLVYFLKRLPNISLSQMQLIDLIEASAFFKNNPNTKVRRGKSNEPRPSSRTQGWWDPVNKELVLFEDSIPATLHETLHAVTLQVLSTVLHRVYKPGRDDLLTPQEDAAQRILFMADRFLKEPARNRRHREVQLMMQDIMRQNEDNQGRVIAINEFMVYALTEEKLKEVLNSRPYVRPGLASKMLSAIKQLFTGIKPNTELKELFWSTHILAKDYTKRVQQEAKNNKPAPELLPEDQTTVSEQPVVETKLEDLPIEEPAEPVADSAVIAKDEKAFEKPPEDSTPVVSETKDKVWPVPYDVLPRISEKPGIGSFPEGYTVQDMERVAAELVDNLKIYFEALKGLWVDAKDQWTKEEFWAQINFGAGLKYDPETYKESEKKGYAPLVSTSAEGFLSGLLNIATIAMQDLEAARRLIAEAKAKEQVGKAIEEKSLLVLEDTPLSLVSLQDKITKADMRANPDTLYLFGDNEQRTGLSGQAKVMRGEPNAVGIRTKIKPSTTKDSYWTDDDYEQNKKVINEDLAPVVEHLRKGGRVVIPSAGLGTGLSEMAKRAPRTFAYLNAAIQRIQKLGQEIIPAETTQKAEPEKAATTDVPNTVSKADARKIAELEKSIKSMQARVGLKNPDGSPDKNALTPVGEKNLADRKIALAELQKKLGVSVQDTASAAPTQTAEPTLEITPEKETAPETKKIESEGFIYTKAEIDIRRQPEEDEGEPIREYSVYVKDPAWVKMMDDAYNNDTDIMSEPIFDDWFSERIVDLFIGDPLKIPMLDVEWVPSNYPGGPYLHFKTALEPSTAIKDVYVNPSPNNLDLFGSEPVQAEGSTAPAVETEATPTAIPTTTSIDQFSWARTGGYEVSSAGDKTFSALNAMITDETGTRSIEERYQGDVKGYDPGGKNWKLGKGKPPKTKMTKEELYREYRSLWGRWAAANPFLMMDLKKKAAAFNGVLSDKFASTDINQARALSDILNTSFAISGETSTADYDVVSYWENEFHNFTVKPKSKKLKDLLAKSIETEGADSGLYNFLDAMVGSTIFGTDDHDMTMEESGPDGRGNITFRIQDFDGTNVSIGSKPAVNPVKEFQQTVELETAPIAVVEDLSEADVKAVQNYEDDIASLEVRNQKLEEKISTILDTFDIPIDMHGDAILFAEEGLASRQRSSEIRNSQAYKDAEARSDAWIGNDENKSEKSTSYEEAIETIQNLVNKLVSNQNDIQEYREAIAVTKGDEIPAKEPQQTTEPPVESAKAPAGRPSPSVADAPAARAVPAPALAVTPVVAAAAEVRENAEVVTSGDTKNVGVNLFTDQNGVSPVQIAYKFNPVLGVGGDVMELADKATLPYELTGELRQELAGILANADTMTRMLNERLNKALDGSYSKEKGSFRKVLLDVFNGKSDIDILYQERKVFNLLDKEALAKGEFKYDEHLLRLAVLASIDYVINDYQRDVWMEDAIKALGLNPSEIRISTDLMSIINFGLPQSTVKESLAAHIGRFWGIQKNNDYTETMVEGIVQSVAEEIIELFTSEGDKHLIDRKNPKNKGVKEDRTKFWMQSRKETLEIPVKKKDAPPIKKTFYSIRSGKKGESLGAARSILEDLLTTEKDTSRTYSVGVPLKKVSDTLLYDPNILVPEQKREAAKEQQDTPYFPSEAMTDIYTWLAMDELATVGSKPTTLAQILGWTDLDGSEFYNKFDAASRAGLNASIQSGLNGVFEQIAALKAYADVIKANDWTQVPTYYQIAFTANGRFQMQGFNPQGNKLAREMFVPARTELDPNNEEDRMLFYAAVNQAFDISSTKLENISLEVASEFIQEKLKDSSDKGFKAGVDAMRARDKKALLAFMQRSDIESSARLLKALHAVVQFEDALAAGKPEVIIDLAVEIDGKTNGPIAASIQNNTDNWTIGELKTQRRGGFFVGRQVDAKNQPLHYAGWKNSETDTVDFYEAVANDLGTLLYEMRDDFNDGMGIDTTRGRTNVENILKIQKLVIGLIAEMGEIKFEKTGVDADGKPTGFQMIIKRKNTKGPITQKIYGAGLKSISAQVANSLMGMIYEDITEAVRNKDGETLYKRVAMIEQIMDMEIGQNKETGMWARVKPSRRPGFRPKLSQVLADRSNVDKWYEGLKDFEFTNDDFSRLRDAIQHTYMKAFDAAFAQNVGESVAAINAVYTTASTTVSTIHRRAFQQAVIAETKRQRADGTLRSNQELSRNDRRKIAKEMRKFELFVGGEYATYSVTGDGTESTTDVDNRIEAAKEDVTREDMEGRFYPFNKTLSGVRTQNTREVPDNPGVKILPFNTITNADVPLITEVSTSEEITHDSLMVHDGIEITNLKNMKAISRVANKAVYKAWTSNTVGPILEAMKAFLETEGAARELKVDTEIVVDGELVDAYDYGRYLVKTLEYYADRREAKIASAKSLANTSEGTPGAEAPYYTEGEVFVGDDTALANHLNKVMNQKMAELQEERNKELKKAFADRIEVEPKNGSALRKALSRNSYSGVAQINELINTLEQHVENEGQRQTLSEVIKSAAFKAMVDAGLNVMILEQGSTPYYDASTNTLHISNVTGETMVHELVHASTIHQLTEHYADPSLDPVRADAVRRLESLANDFLARTFDSNTVESSVQAKMGGLIALGKNIEALNEFMAWSLSNQELIARGKKRIATDPLSQVAALGRRVVAMMRRLLGYASDKVFDQILFNTVVIMKSAPASTRSSTAQLRMELHEGLKDINSAESVRKNDLIKLIGKQITSYLEGRFRGDDELTAKARQSQRLADYTQTQIDSLSAMSRVQAAGFDLNTEQDVLLFRSLHSIFSMDLQLDKLARLEVQKVFEAVSDRLSVEHFLKTMGTTQTEANQAQMLQAERMYRAVLGLPFTADNTGTKLLDPNIDSRGLSDRLGTFLALAQSSPVFREVLETINFQSLELKKQFDNSSVDAFLGSITNTVLNRSTERVINQNNNISTEAALDALTESLLSYEAEAAFEIENKGSSLFRTINLKGKTALEVGSEAASDTLQKIGNRIANPNTPGTNAVAELTAAALGITAAAAEVFSGKRSNARAEGLTALLNNQSAHKPIRELVSEVRGITDDTRLVYRLVKAAKQQISVIRQVYVEGVPKILPQSFSQEFREGFAGQSHKQVADRLRQDWAYMFQGFGKTDIPVLIDILGEKTTYKLFGKNAKQERKKQIDEVMKRLAEDIKALSLPESTTKNILAAYHLKAKQLAGYQMNWIAGVNLLTSADSILGLYNENGLSLTENDHKVLQKAIKDRRDGDGKDLPNTGLNKIVYQLETLVSLEAVDLLKDDAQERIAELIENEKNGIRDTLSYMRDLRKMETEKSDNLMHRINAFKGHMPASARRKYSVIVAKANREAELKELGYVLIRDYDGPQAQFDPANKRAYFFSAHHKLATYNQGAMQTVQDTYFGIDPLTGQAVGPETNGSMIQGDAALLLNKRLKTKKYDHTFNDDVIPRFDHEGNLIGFQQAMGPDMIDQLQISNNLAEALGRWGGRIQEERLARPFNEALIDAMKETYDRDLAEGKGDQYAAFGQEYNEDGQLVFTKELQDDPIWRESYLLIPPAARAYAMKVFGGPIMIRRDMVNNSLGFRSASIGDIFTGQTRMNAKLRETIKEVFMATPFLGENAYKYLVMVEEGIQTIVSEVKHTIVVKSGIILAANTLSNVVQLATREVPLTYIAKRTRTKYAEIAQYKKNEQLKIRLRVDMLAASSKTKAAAIRNRIETIEESERRMSIWPLIEANQFTTISEGITDADKALQDGRIMDWIEKKAAELPGGLSTVARYAIISKDTALYQGLALGVQYSDFVAKAVYYDFLTQERGVTPEEALIKLDEEFINYDLASGRIRTGLESIGLTWFLIFKLRSLKIALNLMRNNPASVMLGMMGGAVLHLDVGLPVSDNIIGATADGSILRAVGPGMVEAGFNLNLWKQMFDSVT